MFCANCKYRNTEHRAGPTWKFTVFLFSNGAGRSGAFCALDANLELMKRTGQVSARTCAWFGKPSSCQLDVFEYAKQLVNARPHLIDSVGQYQFIYDALAEVGKAAMVLVDC